jgi:hypothetical protein
MASGNSVEQKPKRRRGPGKPFVKGLSGNGFGTPFKPGTSGNPSGRPKLLQDVQQLARSHTPEAIQTLVECLKDPRHKVTAAVALLDRAWGKPTTVVAGDEERPVAIHFSWQPAQETLEPQAQPTPQQIGNHTLELVWEAAKDE